jgi:hypothetical protein
MHKAMVTTLGHIGERWRKELEQPSSFSGIASGSVKTHGHMNAELPNAKMNGRSHGANPTVQVNLSIIGGLILLLTV